MVILSHAYMSVSIPSVLSENALPIPFNSAHRVLHMLAELPCLNTMFTSSMYLFIEVVSINI